MIGNLLQQAPGHPLDTVNMAEMQFEDAEAILDQFRDLEDPRSHVNRRHLLGDLIVICIMAVIAGSDGPKSIGTWAEQQQAWLKKYLKLPHGIPSHDTIGRLLAALKPDAFQTCFQGWIRQVAASNGTTELNQIAIDGKVLRRSHDRRKNLGPLWLVSAWAVDHGLSLGQLATEEKSNEITAIPELLDNIEIEKSVITIDAAGCQRDIARKIIAGKGDYVLALKGNQGKLHAEITAYIAKHMEYDFANVEARKYTEQVKGHGRVDEITYYQMPVPPELLNKNKWAGLKTIGVAIRQSQSGSRPSKGVRPLWCRLWGSGPVFCRGGALLNQG